VWSGTVQTTDPSDISKEIKRYVDTVIEGAQKQKCIAVQVMKRIRWIKGVGASDGRVLSLSPPLFQPIQKYHDC
jgi:hypothetical protein